MSGIDSSTGAKPLPPILHVLPSIAREYGGPAVSVRRLAEEMSRMSGSKVEVIARRTRGAEAALADWQVCRPVLVPTVGPERIGYAPQMLRRLRETRAGIIHLHGLWQFQAWAAYRVARATRTPLFVSPRGALEPWALQQGRVQKAVANLFFQRAMLNRAACVVTTSDQEAENVRSAGVRAPVAVVPNGLDVPSLAALKEARVQPGKGRTALFLSRIAPKKGLLELLRAWREVSPKGWTLRIVGPSDRGYAEVVERAIRELGLKGNVVLLGPAWGREKLREFASADLFVLPSFSENFGMAIAEALACGLPVITTRATPWADIERENAGWWIETGAEPLRWALAEATLLPPPELALRGRRGRALVERRYGWPQVAAAMLDVYRKALPSLG